MTQPNGISQVLDPYKDGQGRWLSREPGQIAKLYRLVGTERIPAQFFHIGVYVILPGESVPVHQHPDGEEFVFVLQGRGILLEEDGQEVGAMEQGKLVHVPPAAFHGYLNSEPVPMELLVWCSKGAGLAY